MAAKRDRGLNQCFNICKHHVSPRIFFIEMSGCQPSKHLLLNWAKRFFCQNITRLKTTTKCHKDRFTFYSDLYLDARGWDGHKILFKLVKKKRGAVGVKRRTTEGKHKSARCHKVLPQLQLCRPAEAQLLKAFSCLCSAGNVISKQRLIGQ